MKYVFRKVLAGVLIFVCISFIKSCDVKALQVASSGTPAPSIYMGLKSYVNEGDIIFFNDNVDYVNIATRQDPDDYWGVYYLFDIPANTIMNNFFIDYSSNAVSLYNETNSTQYAGLGKFNSWLNHTISPTSSTCPFSLALNNNNLSDWFYLFSSYMSFKNNNILSCTYKDENNDVQTCVDRLSYITTYGSNTNPLMSINNNNWFLNAGDYNPTTSERDTYYKSTWYYPNENMFLYFKMDPQKVYKDIKITIGGIGNYNGTFSSLNSYGSTDNINNFYNNYQLISGCTYGGLKLTFQSRNPFDDLQISNGSYITESQYNNYVNNNKVISFSQSSVDNLISSQDSLSELTKEFAVQDRLVDYNVSTQEDDNIDFAGALFNSMQETFGNSLGLFTNLLAVPVDLMNENAEYGFMNEVVPGAGGWSCTSYVSRYLESPYNQVSSEVNLTMPFTGNQFTIDCMDVDVLNSHNGLFNQTLHTLYHVILTGFLSYWVIIGYFKLIKETYDPEDNSIEVINL